MKTLINSMNIKLLLLILLNAVFAYFLSKSLVYHNRDLQFNLSLFASLIPLFYLLIFQPRYYFAAFVFLIPLSQSVEISGNVFSFPSENLLLLMAVLFMVRILFIRLPEKSFLKHPVSIILMLDLLWTLIASFTSTMPDVSFKRLIMKTLFVLVFYFSWSTFLQDRKNMRLFFIAYGLGLVIPIINTLLNHSIHHFVMRAAFFVTEPFYPEHTIYATSLTFVLVGLLAVLFERRNESSFSFRIVLIPLIILIIVGDFFAFSRAAWLSLFIAFIGAIFFRFKLPKYSIVLAVFLSAVILYANRDQVLDSFERNPAISSNEDIGEHIQSLTNISSDASNAERLNRWVCAWNMFLDKPILGFGPGTYQFQYGSYQQPEYITRISTFEGDKGNAHSEYLNVLSEAGGPGLILLIILLYVVFKSGLRSYQLAVDYNDRIYILAVILALITYFSHGIVNSFLDVDKTAVLVYVAFTFLVQSDLKNRGSIPESTQK